MNQELIKSWRRAAARCLVLSAFAVGAWCAQATTYYVRTDGDNTDGLTPATAFTAFDTGLAAVIETAGNTLDVGEGSFTCGLKCVITNAVTIAGQGPEKTSVAFNATEALLRMNGNGVGPFLIRGFTFTTQGKHSTYVIDASAKNVTLENLVVKDAQGSQSSNGIVNFSSESGRMSHVVIHGCSTWQKTGGAYFYTKYGVIENCLFYDNTCSLDSADSGANGYWADCSMTMNNCTFGRSTMTSAPSFRERNGSGTYNNCLFYSKNDYGHADLKKSGCLVWGADDYATKWTDYANGDYTLTKAATDAIDQGVAVATVTNDLAGVKRPQGAAYDIGCYELDMSKTDWGKIDAPYVDAGETKDGHCFILTGDGTMTLSKAAIIRRYLVVGGGGAGGFGVGGGGGGGQVVANDKAKLRLEKGQKLTFTVGAGGVSGADNKKPSTNGGNSSLTVGETTVTAVGGGGGASYYVTLGKPVPGNDGANGGGGAHGMHTNDGGPGLGGQPTVAGGFPGGDSYRREEGGQAGGGGGGAGGPGGKSWSLSGLKDQKDWYAGPGGSGVTNDITGVALDYAAGGGGGGDNADSMHGYNSLAGIPGGESAGKGGGGRETGDTGAGHDALPNRGGGGGGGGHDSKDCQVGGAGGSGAVIVVLAPANSGMNIILR